MPLFVLPRQSPIQGGNSFPGALAYFYATGTTTPETVYTSSARTVAHSNPVVADANGVFNSVWLDPTKTYKVRLTTAIGVLLYETDPYPGTNFSQEQIGFALYPRTAAESALTIVNYAYPPGNVLRYGAVANGVTNDAAAFTSAFLWLAQAGGTVTIPPGSYLLTSQVTVTAPADQRCAIMAYGAEILTSGAISGLAITGGSTTGGVTVFGLQVNHRANASATCGFDVYQAWNAKLVDCSVEAHNVAATYAAFRVRNATPADTATGSFWTTIDHCSVRRRSVADGSRIPIGIELRSAANATNIVNCNIGHCDTCVLQTIESGQTYLANGVLIQGSHFELFGDAVHILGADQSDIRGTRIIGCRVENGTNFLKISGTTKQAAVAPFLAGNYWVNDVSAYLSNANSINVNSLDPSTTPAGRVSIQNSGECEFYGSLASHGVVAKAPTGYGLALRNVGNTDLATLTVRSGGGALLSAVNGVYATGVQSISTNATQANNLRGTVTLASGTAAVTFGTAEPDASYFIALGGNAGESFSWASKTTAGFTVNSSNGSSTAVVNWILIR